MSTTEQQARVIQTPRTERKGNILAFWLSSTDHKIIGHLYLITSFFFFLCAGIMALIMRIQLLGPDQHFVSDQQYNELFTMHGTLMLLLFGTPLFVGFANELMPLQIGAPDVAFPRLNLLSYYMFTFGGLILLASFLSPGGSAAFGWYAYSPLTSAIYSPGIGADMWIMGLVLSGLGTILSGPLHPTACSGTLARRGRRTEPGPKDGTPGARDGGAGLGESPCTSLISTLLPGKVKHHSAVKASFQRRID